MNSRFVQFEDYTKKRIVSEFGNPQDPDVYPNQGVVDESDPLYISFIAPPSLVEISPIDKLKAFLAANPDVAAILN